MDKEDPPATEKWCCGRARVTGRHLWLAETALLCPANGTSERINNLFRTHDHLLFYFSFLFQPLMIIGTRVTQGRSARLETRQRESGKSSSQFISNCLQLSACLGPFFFVFSHRGTKSCYTGLFSLAQCTDTFLRNALEITQTICLEELASRLEFSVSEDQEASLEIYSTLQEAEKWEGMGRRIEYQGEFFRNWSMLLGLLFFLPSFFSPCDPIVVLFASILEMVCSQPRCQRLVFLTCGMLFLSMSY